MAGLRCSAGHVHSAWIFAGGAIDLFTVGSVLAVASIIGFISLFGIATRNRVMMITYIHQLVKNEDRKDMTEAVMCGAEEWLVAFPMTALAAGRTRVSLALAAGQSGREILSPMAVMILCGRDRSTLLDICEAKMSSSKVD